MFLAIITLAHSSATNSGHPDADSTSVETSTLAPSEKSVFPVSNTSNNKYSSCASMTFAVKKDCLFQSPPCCKPPSPPLSRIAPTANTISTQAVMMNARFFIFHVTSHNKFKFRNPCDNLILLVLRMPNRPLDKRSHDRNTQHVTCIHFSSG